MQRISQTAGEPVQPCLGRPVHVVGPAHPHSGHRGEHHQRTPAGIAHRTSQQCQQTDLGDVIGMHNRYRMRRVSLGAGLIAEDAEGQHGGADSSVFPDQLFHQRAMRMQVVGIELGSMHGLSPGRSYRRDLRDEVIGAAGGQHDGRSRRQSRGEFKADLATAAENHHDPAGRVGRVFHGCDYSLR